MTRTYSRNPKVHRELDARLDGGGQRGDDVELVTAATRRRLGARGYPEGDRGQRTSTWSKNSSDHAADALYALGATLDTVKAARAGRLTAGAQRMIRHPGTRSDEQIKRMREREEEVARRVKEAKRQAAAGQATVGGHDLETFRRRAAAAANFALEHNGRAYTQGPGRWNPIASGAKPGGRMWDRGDCSSFATWVLHYALGGGADVVNGADWRAGYTGTQMRHGRRLASGSYYQPGDLAFYGNPSTGSHVVVCRKAGNAQTARWASHGSPGGPYDVRLHYRGDFLHVRRYKG